MVAIIDDINRGQGVEEGRISPSAPGEVTLKKSQKGRQWEEEEEEKG